MSPYVHLKQAELKQLLLLGPAAETEQLAKSLEGQDAIEVRRISLAEMMPELIISSEEDESEYAAILGACLEDDQLDGTTVGPDMLGKFKEKEESQLSSSVGMFIWPAVALLLVSLLAWGAVFKQREKNHLQAEQIEQYMTRQIYRANFGSERFSIRL